LAAGIALKARKRTIKAAKSAIGKTIRVTSNVVLLDSRDITKGSRIPPMGMATFIEPITVPAIWG